MGMTMRNVHYLRVVLFLCLYLYLFAPATSQNLTIDAAHPTALYLSSGQLVEGSPISKPRITMVCQRIHVQGVPRLLNLKKYSNTFRVKGMKLLPTGRKRSLMIFLYGSIVGLGTVILRYLSGLLHSVLSDIGLNEDIYNPVALFLLVCLVLAGAWLGFWGVRKLVLSEDGAVDASVSLFVRWAIRIFGAVMITQSSLDPLLATGALVFAASFLPASRTAFGDGIFYHWLIILRYLVEAVKCIPQTFSARDYLYEGTSTDFFDEVSGRETKMFKPRTKAYKWVPCTIFGRSAVTPEKSNFRPDKGTYFSTFHRTPDRKRFSKEEWDAFTKDETRKALKELVSSPEFGQWAVNNAERITLSPANHNDRGDTTRRGGRWFKWF
ncbi:uncharacterized protein LOC116250269 isoform X3 [Nymphaea colorata]|uniref:uncharacterized protein LOC116250269 isoform X3 n=1 Tax=Nymphaea colorata TaxID=210225 RepID=UPI00214F381C|nr:uncharacterized protein LOC116250269 isoform X3 [Nymphaea colorata]